MLVAPLTKFIELDLALNKFFVLACPVIHAFAGLAGEFYQLVL